MALFFPYIVADVQKPQHLVTKNRYRTALICYSRSRHHAKLLIQRHLMLVETKSGTKVASEQHPSRY